LISLPSTIKVLQDGTLSLVSTDGLEPPDRKKPVFTKVALRRLKAEFEQGSGAALLHLATACLNKPLPVELGWLRSYAEQFLFAYCHHAARTTRSARFPVTPPTSTQLQSRIDAAPPVPGAEYLTPDVLLAWWQQLIDAMRVKGGRSPIKWLEEAEPQWCGAGRVRFLLKENKKNKEFPFEFIASYIDGVSVKDGIRYIAIPSAVKKKARKRDDKQLMSLLVPLERAASQLPWLRQVMDSGDIHRSLRLTSQQALEYLNSLGTLQQAGIAVSYPKWWHPDRPPRPKVKVTLGSNKGKGTGIDRLLEMTIGVSLADKPVVAKALRDALKTQDDNPGMVRFNGHWVDLDAQRLGGVLTQLHKAQTVSNKGIPFGQAQRLLAGADYFHAEAAGHDALGGSTMLDLESGAWLNTTLVRMNNPEKIGGRKVAGMRVRLRPYQYHGVHWLRYLGNLQLGACLADDMGLGKTVQVLALLLDLRNSQRRQRPASAQKNTRKKAGQSKRIHAATPSLLVVPASLIANWLAEARRFTPGLQIVVLHNSECKFSLGDDKVVRREIRHADLVITSYGMLRKLDVLQRLQWRWLILDEAQNIRNPQSAQTKAVKTLKSANRLALTGTPVENSLSDLWSIMDFLNPGLLGTQAEFSQFIKRLETGRGSSTGFIESTQSGSHYAPLRKLVSPYLLRRLKTDKRIISDLPDKTEVTRYCTLSKQQVKLYRDAIKSLKKELREVEGIKRRGLVLAYLTRFKQICNHPARVLREWEIPATRQHPRNAGNAAGAATGIHPVS